MSFQSTFEMVSFEKSSVIGAVGPGVETMDMRIQFRSGSVYDYHKVPSVIYDDFLVAPSAGEYFNVHIKGIYACTRMTEEETVEITINRGLLAGLMTILKEHQGELRVQKQTLVSQVELLDRKLEPVGSMVDVISTKLKELKVPASE